jgi:four helix bundle protein
MPNFRNLIVWRESNEFAHIVHLAATRIASRNPRLADQISRAAEAVPALIAEGSGLGTDKAFANKVSEGIGEISEVESHAQRGFMTDSLQRRSTSPSQKGRFRFAAS